MLTVRSMSGEAALSQAWAQWAGEVRRLPCRPRLRWYTTEVTFDRSMEGTEGFMTRMSVSSGGRVGCSSLYNASELQMLALYSFRYLVYHTPRGIA